MADPRESWYDQDDYGFDVERDRYDKGHTSPPLFNQKEALVNEEILRWEHELAQPNYYDYFLEEVTR